MLRRELLERIGGLDEGFPVEFNDVDLCLRLDKLGYRCNTAGGDAFASREPEPRCKSKHYSSKITTADSGTLQMQARIRKTVVASSER